MKGSTCEEIVDALALIIALTVDPNALRGPPPDDPTVNAGEGIRPAPAIAPTMLPSTAMPVQEKDRTTSSASSSASRATPSTRWAPFLSGSLATEVGTLPHLALETAVLLGVERDHGVLAPSLALELSVATSDLTPSSSPRGSYWRGMARAEACPLNFEPSATTSIRPCAWIGVGVLRAEGTSAAVPLTDASAWGDAGLRMRARWQARRFFIEVSAGAVRPFVRPRFVLESPRLVVYETPSVGGLLAIGAGIHF